MFAVGILLPALILYGVITSFVGWQAGMVSSLLFLYAPYHAVQTYVRGAVGESWTLIFWPIIFYAFASQAKPKEAFGRMVIGAIGISGAIVSHTLLGYATMLLFVSGLFCY